MSTPTRAPTAPTASQDSKPSGDTDATPAELQSIEDRIELLQAEALLFSSVPFLPARLRGFMADLVGLLAAMHKQTDALQAQRSGQASDKGPEL